MKTTLSTYVYILFLSLNLQTLFLNCECCQVKAQNQNNLHQVWFIRNGEIAGQTYDNVEIVSIQMFPYAFNLDGTLINLNEGQMAIWFSVDNCTKRYFVDMMDSGEGTFTISNIILNLVLGCNEQNDLDALNQLSSFMLIEQDNGVFVPNNPFNYQIELIDENPAVGMGIYHTLYVSNPNNDWAFFQSAVLSSPSFTATSISINPNPVREVMQLTHTQTTPLHLQIYDIQGRIIQAQTLLPSQTQVDVQALNPGMYLAVFQNEKGEKVCKKFMKQ